MTTYYLTCPFEEKDKAKALGAKWDGNAKQWFVPPDLYESIGIFNNWRPRNRIFLDCSFEEKDEVKSTGGRWDPEVRHWYITPSQSKKKFSKWLPHEEQSESASTPPSPKKAASRRGNAHDAAVLRINEQMTVGQLQNECRHRGVKGYSGKSKDWLLQQLGAGTKWLAAAVASPESSKRSLSDSDTKKATLANKKQKSEAPGVVVEQTKVTKSAPKSAPAKKKKCTTAPASLDWTTAPRVSASLTVAQLSHELMRRLPDTKGTSNKPKPWFLAKLGEGSIWTTSRNMVHDVSSATLVSSKLTVAQLVAELKERIPSIGGLSSKNKDELLQMAAVGSVWTTHGSLASPTKPPPKAPTAKKTPSAVKTATSLASGPKPPPKAPTAKKAPSAVKTAASLASSTKRPPKSPTAKKAPSSVKTATSKKQSAVSTSKAKAPPKAPAKTNRQAVPSTVKSSISKPKATGSKSAKKQPLVATMMARKYSAKADTIKSSVDTQHVTTERIPSAVQSAKLPSTKKSPINVKSE